MRIIINGAFGKMGKVLSDVCLAAGQTVVFKADLPPHGDLQTFEGEADVIIDFSTPSATPLLLEYAIKRKLPVVLATTGHDKRGQALIKAASKRIPIFYSANLSVGIAALVKAVNACACFFCEPDIEILEAHHREKADSPSGTALMIARRLGKKAVYGRKGKRKDEIGISSLRLGSVFGEHEVFIATFSEVISVKHVAYSRAVFAEGALRAAEFVVKKRRGIFDIFDL